MATLPVVSEGTVALLCVMVHPGEALGGFCQAQTLFCYSPYFLHPHFCLLYPAYPAPYQKTLLQWFFCHFPPTSVHYCLLPCTLPAGALSANAVDQFGLEEQDSCGHDGHYTLQPDQVLKPIM